MDLQIQLQQYQPVTPEEDRWKQQLLYDLKEKGEVVLYRECPCHLTASAFIMNPALDKVLMVHHNIYQSFSWVGGHVDGEKDLLQVALREAKEETGITEIWPISSEILSLDRLPVPEHRKKGKVIAPHHHYSVAFGCVAPEKQMLQAQPTENSAVQWITINELPLVCNEAHMLPIYNKVYRRIQQIMQERKTIYEKLPQRLLPWYQKNARDLPWRKDRAPYHVWLSEIMLQQTRVEAVKGYYLRFLSRLPTIKDLADVSEEILLKLWEGLGYYNRARNLQKAARQIVKDYDGNFPSQLDNILALPGIGPYTAGAIASICFDLPTPAIDGNVLRVLSRLTEDYAPMEKEVSKKRISRYLQAVYPRRNCGAFTQSLMELGAICCLPNGQPKCGSCPMNFVCKAYQRGTIAILPAKKPKEHRKIAHKTVFIFHCDNFVAINKREKTGILAGLWQFPNVPKKLDEQSALQVAEQWGVQPTELEKQVHRTHIFTHVEWKMTGYYMRCQHKQKDFTWVSLEELKDAYALPSAFKLFLE